MENGISTSAISLEIIYPVFSSCWAFACPQSLLLPLLKKQRRKHKKSLYMELTRENKAEAHSWQWYLAFLINNISKSYFLLEIHIKEGARWLEYFLSQVLSEEELFYVPYRDDSVIFLFIYPPIHSSTHSFIHESMYLWIYESLSSLSLLCKVSRPKIVHRYF